MPVVPCLHAHPYGPPLVPPQNGLYSIRAYRSGELRTVGNMVDPRW